MQDRLPEGMVDLTGLGLRHPRTGAPVRWYAIGVGRMVAECSDGDGYIMVDQLVDEAFLDRFQFQCYDARCVAWVHSGWMGREMLRAYMYACLTWIWGGDGGVGEPLV